MRSTSATLILVLVLAAASCGDAGFDEAEEQMSVPPTVTSTSLVPVLAEPVPLLIVAKIGGCFMLGPNCSTTLVMSDGSFGVFRTDPADVLAVPDEIVAADLTGEFDVRDLAVTIANTDFAALVGTLGPGTCNACVDGIDLNVRFFTADRPIDLDSATYAFDDDVALFSQLDDLLAAIDGVGDLEPKQRGE